MTHWRDIEALADETDPFIHIAQTGPSRVHCLSRQPPIRGCFWAGLSYQEETRVIGRGRRVPRWDTPSRWSRVSPPPHASLLLRNTAGILTALRPRAVTRPWRLWPAS
jgi:hypothetical protein